MTKQNPPGIENPKSIGYWGFGLVFSKKLFAVYLVMLLGIGILGSRESDTAPPTNLPVLTDEQRRAMDVKLFNELAVRQDGWRGKTRQMRYELIAHMGEIGFEPATLSIKLLEVKPGSWGMRFNKAAYGRLMSLAESGDISALCLASLVAGKWKIGKEEALWAEYVRGAAELGHPACTYYMGKYLRIGAKPFPQDKMKARELVLQAAKSGSQEAQLFLMAAFGQGEWGYDLDTGKAQCWFNVAQRADTGATYTEKSYLFMLTLDARKRGFINFPEYDPEQWCTNLVSSPLNTIQGGNHANS